MSTTLWVVVAVYGEYSGTSWEPAAVFSTEAEARALESLWVAWVDAVPAHPQGASWPQCTALRKGWLLQNPTPHAMCIPDCYCEVAEVEAGGELAKALGKEY